MQLGISNQIHPVVLKIQNSLQKIDCLQLPVSSRHDVESILVRQVSKEIDRVLPWQAGHGQRAAAVAIMLGQMVALSPDELHSLKLAAFLHDIGILLLPAELTMDRNVFESDSYVAIQNHPRLGATLLEPFSFLKDASTVIAHHHERWDGSGYPYGIRGRFIPYGARILAIADAFDAIRVPEASDQTTRNRIALKILRVASGTQFDPQLVEALCLLQEYGCSEQRRDNQL